MRNVLIFGNSASGKSTLARRVCAAESLAHLDLDTLAWTADVPPVRQPFDTSWATLSAFLDTQTSWVIEGCYADLLEPLLPHCSEVIFLDLPTPLCLANARERPWEPHKYPSKEAQDSNLEMLLEWIAQYDVRVDEFSRAAHEALFQQYEGPRTRYTQNPNISTG